MGGMKKGSLIPKIHDRILKNNRVGVGCPDPIDASTTQLLQHI